MSLETEVAALTAATTNLLNSVTTNKATLDATLVISNASAVAALASQAIANTKAGEALGFAASSLAVYGTNAAMTAAVAPAEVLALYALRNPPVEPL